MASPSTKETLRNNLRTKRRDLAKSAAAITANALVDHFLAAWPGLDVNTVVAGYYPMGSEINPLPLMEAAAKAGATLALPVVIKENAPLQFRLYNKGDPLEIGLVGAMEPLEAAETAIPNIVLVPLLGFDQNGHRIGQGMGYYDRTLQALRAKHVVYAIGLAYEDQRCEAIPVDQHDEPLDAVITEARSRVFQPGKAA